MTETALRREPTDAQLRAARHLWLHWGTVTAASPAELPVMVGGEGCYVWDEHGNRYLDGLSGLFCVNVGYGRRELGEAAAAQSAELGYFPIWGHAHRPGIDLAERIAQLTPGDLNRVFFTSGGAEGVETAIKMSRMYHRLRGQPLRVKVIARELAYHGTTLGALAATGLPAARVPFEPLAPGGVHARNTQSYLGADEDPPAAVDSIDDRIRFEGPETVAAVIVEPVQNSGGCLTPPTGYFDRLREICDRHGVLLISDETICAWGRLGHWFGAQRFDFLPDIITTAKGITSAYAPLGAVIVRDSVAEPFLDSGAVFPHGLTFAGHPLSAAVALRNLDILEREQLLDHVLEHEPGFRSRLEGLRELPIVGDVRGAGYFWGLELVRDAQRGERFTRQQCGEIVPLLSDGLRRAGLICRADDRGFPVIQLAPPLVAGEAELDRIAATLRSVLAEACRRLPFID